MDYPEGYTYIKAVGRRDQETEEDIYIYTMKLWKEGRAGQRKDGNCGRKDQGTAEDIHARYGRRGEQQEREGQKKV